MYINAKIGGLALCSLLNSNSAIAWSYGAEPGLVHEHEILPTVVVGPPTSTEYPEPICSKCRITVKRSGDPSEDSGLFSLIYDDDVFPLLDANIQLTLALLDDEYVTVTLNDVHLSVGEEVAATLEAEEGWSWEDVSCVWVRVSPTAEAPV